MAGPFCKIAHRLYLVNVTRYILFSHFKIAGGHRQSPFQHYPEKDPLKDDFFIKLIY